MQAALDVSFYVLGVVFTLGVLMVLVLIRDVLFHGRFDVRLPTVRAVPTTALDAARETLQTLKAEVATARGERQDAIAYEIKHLEHRIAALEDKTYSDQSDYYDAAKTRERVWREWRSAHEQARRAPFGQRRAARNRSDELRESYRKLDREVREEYERAVARDAMTLEELRTQGVFSLQVLQPEAASASPGARAQAAGGAPAPGTATETATRGRVPGAPGRKWMTPLPPYPPSEGGLLGQVDLTLPDVVKSERTYVDPTLSLAGVPGGVISGADFTRSSFAEVEFVGVHRYAGCRFTATDLRRIELKRAESPHVFQDCDFQGASLAQAHLAGVVFRRCNLSATHWRSARLDRVKFEQCRLDGVHWDGVDLSRTVMSEDMLSQADFDFAGKPPLNLRPAMESPPELAQPSAQAPANAPPRAPEGTPRPGATGDEPPPDAEANPGSGAPEAAGPRESPAEPNPPPTEGSGNAPAAPERPEE